MIHEQILIGGDRNYAYIIGCEETKEAAIIDPAYNPEELDVKLRKLGLTLKYIINTHGHYDHTNGNKYFTQKYGVPVVTHENADPAPENIKVKDNDTLQLGNLKLKFLYTPGHTYDSICVHVENKLYTGDTLFVGKVGGTGLGRDAEDEFESLFNKLMKLPDHTEVYPGHNYGVKPFSTIGYEKQTNPFILRSNYKDFLDLKINWAEYKREHGIK